MCQFILSGRDNKICLSSGNLFFARVTILCNGVAGETAEQIVLGSTLGTFTHIDHFTDLNKMVGHDLTNLFASNHSPLNSYFEVLPLTVSQEGSKITSAPILCPVWANLLNRIKVG